MTTKNKKIVLGMSGGVDSTAAALILKEAGYEVTGIFMDVLGNQEDVIETARRVSSQIGIAFQSCRIDRDFRETIIHPFCQAYEAGETPNPCIWCNPAIKFSLLVRTADSLGASHIATGHYAGVFFDPVDSVFRLSKARAREKDQSYLLYRLPQHILSRTIFPLGSFESKADVRLMVRDERAGNEEKKDSQEICFIKNGSYADFIDATGYQSLPGDFIDVSGAIIGRHKGLIHYTVGQRKGLGTTFGRPMYVLGISASTNTVTLGSNDDLQASVVLARDLFFTGPEGREALISEHLIGKELQAKIRYTAESAPARIEAVNNDVMQVRFHQPQRGPTPGQSIVLYDGEVLIGGGIITIK